MTTTNQITAVEELKKTIDDCDRSHEDGVSRLSGCPKLIYGAGNYGRIIYRLLTQNGLPSEEFLGFLDAAEGGATLFGLPVLHPDDSIVSNTLRKESEVIIAIYCSLEEQDRIANHLRLLGYMNIRTGYETAISFHTANDPTTRIAGSGYLQVNIENILNGCSFWEDQRSLETYLNHFIGYIRCDVRPFLFETEHKQYFPPYPLKEKGHARFIDCGAFDGDTIRELFLAASGTRQPNSVSITARLQQVQCRKTVMDSSNASLSTTRFTALIQRSSRWMSKEQSHLLCRELNI
jgi:hypothetical protein